MFGAASSIQLCLLVQVMGLRPPLLHHLLHLPPPLPGRMPLPQRPPQVMANLAVPLLLPHLQYLTFLIRSQPQQQQGVKLNQVAVNQIPSLPVSVNAHRAALDCSRAAYVYTLLCVQCSCNNDIDLLL